MAKHLHIVRNPVIYQGVSPCLLVLGKNMHVPEERELFQSPLVKTGLRRKHVVVPPCVGAGSESGYVRACVVVQIISLHKYRVSVHVDVVRETERLELGIVMAVIALDDLAVLVAQGTAVPEHGHTVLGVIVQVSGTQGVPVLVPKLDQRASELSEVLVDEIVEALAAEHCVVLNDLDVAESVYNILVDIPQGGVADQKS